jgi:uncharacterized LabA/DUF88 family protein
MSDNPYQGHSILLVDYQNLYYYLKSRFDNATAGDHLIDFLQNVRGFFADEGNPVAVARAYADFSGLDDHSRHVQRALYLLGIDPVFVPSTMHRNTTDLQLCIDALDLHVNRADLQTVVIVSGDRDYVPLIQALQQRGKDVVLVAFREHLSARLFEFVETGDQMDAEQFLTDDARTSLLEDPHADEKPQLQTVFSNVGELPFQIDFDALRVIEDFFGQYDEVYLTPLLRKLSEVLGEIEDHDPKSLIGDLEECGAVRLERRRGMPYDYTVLIVNSDHPAVAELKRAAAARRELRTNGEGQAAIEDAGVIAPIEGE